MNQTEPEHSTTADNKSELSDPGLAAAYLQSSLEEAQEDDDPGVFLEALLDVVKATESDEDLAERVARARSSFYKSLSSKGNPGFATVLRLLPTLGLRFEVVPIDDSAAGARNRSQPARRPRPGTVIRREPGSRKAVTVRKRESGQDAPE